MSESQNLAWSEIRLFFSLLTQFYVISGTSPTYPKTTQKKVANDLARHWLQRKTAHSPFHLANKSREDVKTTPLEDSVLDIWVLFYKQGKEEWQEFDCRGDSVIAR